MKKILTIEPDLEGLEVEDILLDLDLIESMYLPNKIDNINGTPILMEIFKEGILKRTKMGKSVSLWKCRKKTQSPRKPLKYLVRVRGNGVSQFFFLDPQIVETIVILAREIEKHKLERTIVTKKVFNA